VSDGWVIARDPLRLTWGRHTMFVDLAADSVLPAERDGRRIAVEVKGFGGPSEVHELAQALGQYLLYRAVLARLDPTRTLYLAVPVRVFGTTFESPLGRAIRADYGIAVVTFDPDREVIRQWIDSTNTGPSSAPS